MVNDKSQDKSDGKVLPTKKQRELLTFIDEFIKEHGYSPSYREIMSSLNYNSVATVALHVNNLIKRGHLHKRDRSARSLEVVESVDDEPKLKNKSVAPAEEKWLIQKIEYFFDEAENSGQLTQAQIDELYVLIGALKVLGLEGAAHSFMPRLTAVRKRLGE
ncbi:MAG: hypothetical protein U5K77_02105 [Candidatus Saccharibacteria bacterium]|nr:hypothetical protein [Candidatus Saccharibacteria bacterium]